MKQIIRVLAQMQTHMHAYNTMGIVVLHRGIILWMTKKLYILNTLGNVGLQEVILETMKGIQIEVCVNSDGNYQKAMQNAAELVAKVMKEEGIPISRVVQHNHFSGKNCYVLVEFWNQFISMVGACTGNTQQQKPVTNNNKYRVMTGTYSTIQAAENVLDVLKHRFGWVSYIEPDGSKWRVKTGTFTGMDAAQAGANKIKAAKLAQVANVVGL